MQEQNNKENKTQKSQRNNSLIISIIVIASIIIVVGVGIIVGIKSYDKYQTQSEKRENRNSQNEEDDDCENNLNVSSNNIHKFDPNKFDPVDRKPVIYIYPEQEIEVSVKLGKPKLLTCTYPKYDESTGWKVIANPNGTLVDETNREYYSLYWEGKKATEVKFNDGFVVKGEDTIEFLEEKLEILGLTEKEAQEFIIYWLPQMENNEYNLIRFESIEEINENMPLEITPTPDTVIRIMMDWKALDECIEIPEQELNSIQRSGYTVVEWGGSEIK